MTDVDLRKLAAEVVGRAALEERFGSRPLSALDAVLLQKSASADQDLLRVASSFETGNSLSVYEKLGGKYLTPPKDADELDRVEHQLAVEEFNALRKTDPALAKKRYGSLKQLWHDHFGPYDQDYAPRGAR